MITIGKKAAYKLHLGLDHDGLIPAFAAVTAGKVGDQVQAKLMNFPKDSAVVFDICLTKPPVRF